MRIQNRTSEPSDTSPPSLLGQPHICLHHSTPHWNAIRRVPTLAPEDLHPPARMGIGIKNFLEMELLSSNGQGTDDVGAKPPTEGGSKFTSTDGPIGRRPRENGGDPRESRGERARCDVDRLEFSFSARNLLAIPPPNKWRGSKIKVHDKDVIQPQKQERTTQNLSKAQLRKDEIRPEQERGANGSTINAQANSQEATGAPGNTGNVVNGRRIYKTRNGQMLYGLGRNGLKRGKKKADAGNLPRPATPPRLSEPSQ